eukprot:13661197-Alexandrium_andersonii.AAC.1
MLDFRYAPQGLAISAAACMCKAIKTLQGLAGLCEPLAAHQTPDDVSILLATSGDASEVKRPRG